MNKEFEKKFVLKAVPEDYLLGRANDCWQWIEQQLDAKDNLIEKLKLEAKMHAQEARAQSSIVLDIYKYFGIQKGDWNGSVPVVEAHEQQLIDAKVDTLKRITDFCWDESLNRRIKNIIKELEEK